MPSTGVGSSIISRVMPNKGVMGLTAPEVKLGEIAPPDALGSLSIPTTAPEMGNLGKIGSLGDPLGGTGKLGAGDLGIFPPPLPSAAPGAPPPGGVPTGGQSLNGMTSLGGEWAGVDRWNNEIRASASKYGYDPDYIKALMLLESGGDPNAAGSAGVWGPMQVNSNAWGYGPWSTDAVANIDKGAEILKFYLDASGGDFYQALRHYHGIGWDGNTTDTQYADIVLGNYNKLKDAGGGSFSGGGTGSFGGGKGVGSIWGGGEGDYPITQEMGLTAFAQQSGDYYKFAQAYHGFQGHPGLDIGTPSGTQLYSPVSGTVVFGGASGYYCNYKTCNTPGVGEFRIRLDNGDELILGHMSQINLQPGQRINAGTAVGLSGGENGDHVHVEYRQADGQGGFYIKDPREMLGGVSITGGGTPGGAMYQQGAVYESPTQRARRILGGG